MKNIISTMILLLGLTSIQAQEGFVFKGKLNMPDGTVVGIVADVPGSSNEEIGTDTLKNGVFTIKGKVKAPTTATLITNNLHLIDVNHWSDDSIKWTYTEFFLGNDSYEVAPDLVVKGGNMEADYNELLALGGDNADVWAYIYRHPHSAVSLYLANKMLKRAYHLTDEQVNVLAETITSVPDDPINLGKFRNTLIAARKTTLYSPLTDLSLLDINGNPTSLVKAAQTVSRKGTYTLVDFWASWCGICLYMIPQVKELADKYSDRLQVIGVSIDTKDDAWKKAMEKHHEPWPQYITTQEGRQDLFDKYNVGNGVPYYVLLNDDGKVIGSPDGPEAIEKMILSESSGSLKEPSLSKNETDKAEEELVASWKKEKKEEYTELPRNPILKHGNRQMPLFWTVYGNEPANGRSLYISLHGGGNCPHPINHQQWINQTRLYTPKEGVYVAPHCVVDDWNMWFQPDLDQYYRDIISMGVALYNVNPDKVYIMGYSAGGDGVWRMAPRMADTWAAASMMAGHPGNVSLVNLRNIPFSIWCGAEDAAYNRNTLCKNRIAQMDSLHRTDPKGYIFEGHMVAGKPHWMDRVDTVAVDWMARYMRNPYPKQVVWRQEEVCRPYFYWIGISPLEEQAGKEIRADINGNTIILTHCDYKEVTLYLNDKLVNLDKSIKVKYNKKTIFKGKVERKKSLMEQTLRQRQDIRFIFPAEIQLKINH